MYADDITIMVSDRKSGKKVFDILKQFSICSGLKINKEKTEGMWIGSLRDDKEELYNISWPKTPIKLLGIYLSYDKGSAIKANFDDKIEKLKKQLHWWKSRDLSLMGRILIVKTLGLSKFSLLAAMIHVPDDYVKSINSIIYEYIWKGKSDKVKRTILSQDFENGGYKMSNLLTMCKAAKVKWVSRYLNPKYADWKHTFESFFHEERLDICLQSNFCIKQMSSNIPDYYKDAISITGLISRKTLSITRRM